MKEVDLIKEAGNLLGECADLIDRELAGDLDLTVPDPDPEETKELLDRVMKCVMRLDDYIVARETSLVPEKN